MRRVNTHRRVRNPTDAAARCCIVAADRTTCQSRSRVRPGRIERGVNRSCAIDRRVSRRGISPDGFRGIVAVLRIDQCPRDDVVASSSLLNHRRWSSLNMMQEIPGAPADDHRASKSVLLNTFVVKKKRCRVYLHRGTLVWETERPPYSKLQRYYCEIPRAGEANRLSSTNENSYRTIRSTWVEMNTTRLNRHEAF